MPTRKDILTFFINIKLELQKMEYNYLDKNNVKKWFIINFKLKVMLVHLFKK